MQQLPATTQIKGFSADHLAVATKRLDLRPRLIHLLLLAGAFVAFIFMLTHIPVVGTLVDPARFRSSPLPVDKVFHFTCYFGLMILALTILASCQAKFNLRWKWSYFRSPAPWVVGFLVFCYGLFDETTQLLVGRNFEWLDLLADLGGILVAQFCFCASFASGLLDRLIRR